MDGINAISTHELIKVQQQQKKFVSFFLAMFFTSTVTFASEEILLDKLADAGVELAAFCAPKVGSKVLHEKGGMINAFKPAYVKPKHEVTANHLFKRKHGEAIGGSMDPTQRRLATIADHMETQEKLITYREEWMAREVTLTGAVTISGEGYETQVVDFGRKPENSIELSGPAKWDAVDVATYDPTDDIEMWAANATGNINFMVMGQGAWLKFRKFKAVKDKLETRRGSSSSLETALKDLGDVVSHKGHFGDVEIVVLTGEFTNPETKSDERWMPTNKILLCPSMHNGTRAYGAIQDAKLNSQGIYETARAPKHWVTDGDPSAEYVQTLSAPLMVPDNGNANAFVDITVY